MFNSICGQSQWAKIWLGVSALLTAYIVPVVGLLVACFAFTVIDMIYGIKDKGYIYRKIKSLVMTVFIVFLFLFILIQKVL